MSKDLAIVGAAFDQASDAMIITDAAEKVVRVNRRFTQLTGYEPQEIIGQTPAMLRSGRNDPQLFTQVWASVNASGHWQGEIWDRKKNGRLFVAELTISAVTNHHNKVVYYLGVYRDITAAKDAATKKQQQETREPQTFLLNRGAFFEQLDALCKQAPQRGDKDCGALLLIDFDDFAGINDRHGIEGGDAILSEAARRLRKGLRDSDILGRLDGDEFAVILSALPSPQDVEKVVGKVLEKLAQPYMLDVGNEVSVRCSIGLALLASRKHDLAGLLREANQALRDAKQQGGGRWRRHS